MDYRTTVVLLSSSPNDWGGLLGPPQEEDDWGGLQDDSSPTVVPPSHFIWEADLVEPGRHGSTKSWITARSWIQVELVEP